MAFGANARHRLPGGLSEEQLVTFSLALVDRRLDFLQLRGDA